MHEQSRFIATCAKDFEGLAAAEIGAMGASDLKETVGAVRFVGPLETGLRACLWSRVASRILLELADVECSDALGLYSAVRAIPWEDHVLPTGTLAVDATGTSPELANTAFTAMKTKDAIVDRMRDIAGERPSVDLESPDVRVNVRLHSGRATISLDLSGEPLHRRGYRVAGVQVEAPLKETLAAAILLRAGWPMKASEGGALIDPMCGSGTLLIEGALMAGDRAPGLLRQRWGHDRWLGGQAETWHRLLDEADERAETGTDGIPPIGGFDSDARAIDIAAACVKNAGLAAAVSLSRSSLDELAPMPGMTGGLVIVNPPHGNRLGSVSGLLRLYSTLGRVLAERFEGWSAAVFTPSDELARAVGLRSRKSYSLPSGKVAARLYLFEIVDNIWREV